MTEHTSITGINIIDSGRGHPGLITAALGDRITTSEPVDDTEHQLDDKEASSKHEDGQRMDEEEAVSHSNKRSQGRSLKRRPFALKARSSVSYITLVVGWGMFVDLCIYGIVSPVVPFRLRDLHYQNVESLTGWLVAVYAGGLIASSFPVAYLGERIKSRKWPLIATLLFMEGALVMFMLSKSFALLAVSRILQGISGTGVFTLGIALLADSVPEAQLGSVVGLASLGISLGPLCGPPIGGALYGALGWYSPWIFSLGIVALDLVLRLLVIEVRDAAEWLPEESRPLLPPRKKTRGSALFTVLLNTRALVSLGLGFCIGFYFGGLMDAALTLRLNQRYGLDSTGAGLVFIASGVTSCFAGPAGGWLGDKFGPRPVVMVAISVSAAVFALLTINALPLAGFIVIIGASGLSGLAIPGVLSELTGVVNDTPGLGLAHVFGLFNLTYSLGSFVGPIAAGNLLQTLGIARGWYAMAGMSAGFLILHVPLIWLKYPGKAPRDDSTSTAGPEMEVTAVA